MFGALDNFVGLVRISTLCEIFKDDHKSYSVIVILNKSVVQYSILEWSFYAVASLDNL